MLSWEWESRVQSHYIPPVLSVFLHPYCLLWESGVSKRPIAVICPGHLSRRSPFSLVPNIINIIRQNFQNCAPAISLVFLPSLLSVNTIRHNVQNCAPAISLDFLSSLLSPNTISHNFQNCAPATSLVFLPSLLSLNTIRQRFSQADPPL